MLKILLTYLAFADESDPFADLKEIGNKIIPSDIWGFVIQLCATGILVLIIAKFLVKPARKFIAARKEYIENNLSEAANKNKEADEKLMEANARMKEARLAGKEIIDTAKVTALNEKDRIVEETKKEVLSMKQKAKEDIEMERQKMKEDLSSEVIDVALLAASKVVEREVTTQDNQRIIADFIKEQ